MHRTPIIIFLESLSVASILTTASYLVAFAFGWITDINWLEVFCVFTSYSCTYMCVFQSRWNYPMALVTTLAYAYLFWQADLIGLAALNVYLPVALTVGWFLWGPDGNTRPVKRLALDHWLFVYLAFGLVTWALTMVFVNAVGGEIGKLDASVLALTILAQFLLDTKKLETWYVWAIINVVTIYLTYETLPLVAFQYVFFLANTVWGYWEWRKSMRGQPANLHIPPRPEPQPVGR